MIDILPLLTGLSQALKGLALFAGIILALDFIKIHTGLSEEPPHNSKGNARAWGLVGIGVIIGGWSVLELGTQMLAIKTTVASIVASFFMWLFIAVGLVDRAALRTSRPVYLFVSSLLFLITATFLYLGRP